MKPLIPNEDVIRVEPDPTRLDSASWNALLQTQESPTPFMRLEYLAALHASGSAIPATGWTPRFVTLHRDGRLIAAAPVYLKDHSFGEYVFDWSWADAYRRHGLSYYPKLLVAVPFTPVPGSRLLAVDDDARQRLIDVVGAVAEREDASSVHVLFPGSAEVPALDRAGWMRRHGVQFHWRRDGRTPVTDFGAFIATMQRDKRKKILQERRRVADAGVRFSVHEGRAIDPPLWDFFHRCYESTYLAHRSTPYLTREFFRLTSESMPEHWLMFVAHRAGAPVATSLLAIDRGRGVAYGRYWGAIEYVPCLHFEACYYRPLEWCIDNGFSRFEGGAQGEHKMARGLLPVRTDSVHWLSHAGFAGAVDEFLVRERAGLAHYVDELRDRNPFRPDD